LWNSTTTKAKSVPKSSCHAEIIAASKCLDKIRWMTYLLDHAHINYVSPVPLYIDNKAAIHTMQNPYCTKETRHLHPSLFDLREAHEGKVILLTYKSTDEQKADVLTKSLCGAPMLRGRLMVSVNDVYPMK
jgi:hypothetical protein